MIGFIKLHECSFQVESIEMPKCSRKRDLELSMPAYVPPTKSAKHTTAGKAQSPKLTKSSDTVAGKAENPSRAAGKAQSPCSTTKLTNTSDTVAGMD